MRRNIIPALIINFSCLVGGLAAWAGPPPDDGTFEYQRLESRAPLPVQLTEPFAEYANRVKKSQNGQEDRRTRKSREAFYLKSTYSGSRLFRSGKILFNDDVSAYLTEIKDHLLRDEPEVRDSVSIHAVFSPVANAFATDDGIILINLGLISKLRNEAQLAFIIAHEIVHFKEKHAVDIYLEEQLIRRGKGDYNRLPSDDRIFASSAYSRARELEADLKGFEIFKKSDYGTDGIAGAFDMLTRKTEGFDDLSFGPELVASAWFRPADSLFTMPLREVEPSADPLSTHALPEERNALLDSLIREMPDSGRTFIARQPGDFDRMVRQARYEVTALLYAEGDFISCIYQNYLLDHHYGPSECTRILTAKSWAAIAQASARGRFRTYSSPTDEVAGHEQRLHAIFEAVNASGHTGIVSLALGKLLEGESMQPEDSMYTRLTELVLREIFQRMSVTWFDLVRDVEDKVPVFTDSLVASLLARPGLAERVEHWRYAAVVEPPEEIDRTVDRYSHGDQRPFQSDRLLVVDPFFYKLDAKKHESLQIVESQAGQMDLLDRLRNNARKAGLELTLLSPYELQADDIEPFRHLTMARRWFFFNHDHTRSPDLNVLSAAQREALIDVYGTEHVLFMGAFSIEDRNLVKRVMAFYVFALPPFWPYTLPKWINADHSTWIVGSVYNLRTGRNEFNYGFNVQHRTRDFIMDSHLFNMLYNISN